MRIIQLAVGSYETNTYLYYDENSLEGALIDPGAEAGRIRAMVEETVVRVRAILLTHGHPDHIGAVMELKEDFNAELLACRDEAMLLMALSRPRLPGVEPADNDIKADRQFVDGDVLRFGAGEVRVIHTPGHTAGSCCFYDEAAGVLFSGDTLFYASVGRTDLPTGDYGALVESIRNKLYRLPEETRVLPGHGRETTIGFEKSGNPYVNGLRGC